MNVQLPTTPDITAYWMWAEYPGKFIPYHTDATVDIELAHLQQKLCVDLSQEASRLPYTIDFQHMKQTRHHYNTRRDIQRVPLPAGTTLQTLLKPQPVASNPAVPPVGSMAGASHLVTGSGLMFGTSLPGAAPSYVGSGSGLVLGTTPFHAVSGSGPMSGATPLPPSYGSGLSSTAPLIGFGTPYYSGYTTGTAMGTSHPVPTMGSSHLHLGYLGHTHPGLGTTSHIVSTANISGHISSSSILSNSSTPPSLTPASYHGSTTATSSMTTRSKSNSRKTSKAAASTAMSTTSVPKKSGKGKSRAKTRKTAAKEPASSHAVGGASNHGDNALSAYARKVNRLRAKSDEVRRFES